MAIYRLSIEVLQADDRDAATERLTDLRTAMRDIDGVFVYPEDETAPWGAPNRPGTFNMDFDSANFGEAEADTACMDKISAFVTNRA